VSLDEFDLVLGTLPIGTDNKRLHPDRRLIRDVLLCTRIDVLCVALKKCRLVPPNPRPVIFINANTLLLFIFNRIDKSDPILERRTWASVAGTCTGWARICAIFRRREGINFSGNEQPFTSLRAISIPAVWKSVCW
jgi:hypothetical protein